MDPYSIVGHSVIVMKKKMTLQHNRPETLDQESGMGHWNFESNNAEKV